MDINTQNSSGMMNGIPPVGKNQKKIGPIIGILIIILILIISSLYFFGKRLNTQTPNNIEVNQNTNTENIIRNEAIVSTSTDIDSIQSDLDNQLKDIDYSF